ncbi:hypothetical protein GCM10009430_45740 [Aquimarina litoralis]|uniref:Uncharacterized protein n=1 Tax=Aquimarina litoralis TaxID=584605 RepID=A0ABN1J8X4_9FLAO
MKHSILLLLFIITFSCKSDSSNVILEYSIEEQNFTIEIPTNFKEADSQYVKEFYKDGINIFKEYGYTALSNQKSIFFFTNNEFTLLKGKTYSLNQYVTNNYENQWTRMKGILFDLKQKMVNSMESATLDSISRIEKINGTKFYVFETNVQLLDLNKKNTNLKSLRYSTLINNTDFVIDADYLNRIDEKEILNSIKSIKIKK